VSGKKPDVEELREFLRERLPEHMIPGKLVALESLPLSANNKVDYKRLPEISVGDDKGRPYEAPQGEIEQGLAKIWRELLQVERVGRSDNFFHLGGHSLLASKLVSRLKQERGLSLSLATVFQFPKLSSLAAQASALGEVCGAVIPRATRGDVVQMSYSQQRLWLVEEMEDGADAGYRVYFGLRLEGDLHEPALQAGLDEIVARHEVLRTRFFEEDGVPMQRIGSVEPFVLERVSVDSEEGLEEVVRRESRRRFLLKEEAPIRGVLVKVGEQNHVLLINMHHMVSDGWSLHVFKQELSELYGAKVEGRESQLPELPLQYGDYVVW